MNPRTVFRFILAVVVVAGVAALGVGAYQAGLAAGIAQDGGTVVAPAYGYGYGWHPFGFGFGFFGFLGMLLFLFLIIGLVRAAFGGGRGRGRGGPGRWGPDQEHGRWSAREQAWEEWHRRTHGDAGGSGATSDPSRPASSGEGRSTFGG